MIISKMKQQPRGWFSDSAYLHSGSRIRKGSCNYEMKASPLNSQNTTPSPFLYTGRRYRSEKETRHSKFFGVSSRPITPYTSNHPLHPNQLASRRSFSSLHVSSMHAYSIPLSDSQRSLNLRKREKINISSREEKNHESRFRRIINLTLPSSCNSLNSGQIIRLTARNLQQLWKNIKWRRKIIEILEVTRSFKFDCIHFRRKLPT